jgi:hypothetical protein
MISILQNSSTTHTKSKCLMQRSEESFQCLFHLCGQHYGTELGDIIPDEGDFNVGYFEGRQHTKKWLMTRQDIYVMYTHFLGKTCVSVWCDGIETDVSDEETPVNTSVHVRKRGQQEEELEQVFLQIKEKHGSMYSGPQLRLWARMINEDS